MNCDDSANGDAASMLSEGWPVKIVHHIPTIAAQMLERETITF